MVGLYKKIKIILIGLLLGILPISQEIRAAILSVPTTQDNARLVISPYAQAVPNDSYTFIGVSHPSLDSAQTQIGVALEVWNMTTVPNNAAGRAAIFTVDAGETHRIFVVNLSHSSINLNTAAFTDSRTHLILTLDSAQFGSVRVVSINEDPSTPAVVGGINKYDNLAQLNMWGIVFVESSSTGFAMEFIGDAQDSTIGRQNVDTVLAPVNNLSTGISRGIN